jgi:hypothetical protein
MLIAESVLALWLGVALMRSRTELRPSVRAPIKTLIALFVAVLVALAPVPALVAVIVGSAAYLVVLVVLRAVPLDVWRATFNRGTPR